MGSWRWRFLAWPLLLHTKVCKLFHFLWGPVIKSTATVTEITWAHIAEYYSNYRIAGIVFMTDIGIMNLFTWLEIYSCMLIWTYTYIYIYIPEDELEVSNNHKKHDQYNASIISKEIPYLKVYTSKRCFSTKSPRTDGVLPKIMMKGPNVLQQELWKSSWETSPPNLRFFWVELIPLTTNDFYSGAPVICSIYRGYIYWNKHIKLFALGTEEWHWWLGILPYSALTWALCMLTAQLWHVAPSADSLGCLGQECGGLEEGGGQSQVRVTCLKSYSSYKYMHVDTMGSPNITLYVHCNGQFFKLLKNCSTLVKNIINQDIF